MQLIKEKMEALTLATLVWTCLLSRFEDEKKSTHATPECEREPVHCNGPDGGLGPGRGEGRFGEESEDEGHDGSRDILARAGLD